MHGLGVAQAKLRVIPNGVNTQIFKPYQSRFLHNYLGIPEHSRIILTIGRLSASKGLQILLIAASGLLKKSNDIHLVLVGRGPEEERLRELSLLLGVSKQVHIVTALFLPYEKVPDLYNSAEICVNPSLSEPFGMTALEAQSCGKAVVCANTGGLSDIVLDNVTGKLVSPGSQTELRAALNELLQADPSKFETEARQRAVRFFDWHTVSQSYADSLASCVESFS
jgi:glycosyltransferase involved in cell wall biosynthesis